MTRQNHVIIKQFRELAARDLLYLQAELCDLQYYLNQQSRNDANSPNEERLYSDRDWYHLRHATGDDGRQWNLVLRIREKLREYYSAIQQYQNVAKLPRPTKQQNEIVYSYTLSPSLGGNCNFLGRDLKSQVPENETALYQYSDSGFRLAAHTIGSVLSTIVPILSVVVLYYTESMPLRLALVCIFSVIFSMAMSLITNARRVEIFAGAAASVYFSLFTLTFRANDLISFASVQVVFISKS
ncbi:hypothetical protein M426DRAFT_259609 [Hypoxylon sp. CI-4A]|nr:hypothetical protein M426DRAFT_259609 [Hypoxylon sp. CI-4A]